MTNDEVVKELNKILTLEHGHLAMYKGYLNFKDKEIRKALKTFTEIELTHINELENILKNLGTKPSLLIESGDIIGRMLGITVNLTDAKKAIEAFRFVEKKSHEGYAKVISRMEEADSERTQFIAELLTGNMVESKLMQLWLDDYLKTH